MGAKMSIRESFYKKVESNRIKQALEKAVRQTAMDLQKAAMKEAPEDTGNLRRSHSIDVRISSEMIEALLKNSAKYWSYVAFGTSKMAANDFVTRAIEQVNPAAKVSEYFHKYYQGGG